MRKLNKIKIYNDNTLKVWSEGRIKRWKGRVQNHLDGIIKDHKDKNGAKPYIIEFENYISLMEKIIKEKQENNTIVPNDNFEDDING